MYSPSMHVFFLPATQPGDMKPPAIRAHPKRDVEVSDEVKSCVDLTNAVYRLNGIFVGLGYNGIQWDSVINYSFLLAKMVLEAGKIVT